MTVDSQINATMDGTQTRDRNIKSPFMVEAFVPFSVDELDGSLMRAFAKWRDRLWFVPDDFPKQPELKNVSKIYIPFREMHVSRRVHFKGERLKSRIRSVGNDGNWWEDEEWQRFEGDVYDHRRRSLARMTTACSNLWEGNVCNWLTDDKNSLLPATLFNNSHTSSTIVTLAPSSTDQQELLRRSLRVGEREAKNYAQQYVHNMYGGSNNVRHMTFRVREIGSSYVDLYLPGIEAYYEYGEKEYRVVVNGQTSTCHGQRPYSQGKLWIYVGTPVFAVLAICAVAWFARKKLRS